ncbi:MAG: hypothetical protein ACREQF_03690 [Candidatus Binataceae bacterium]
MLADLRSRRVGFSLAIAFLVATGAAIVLSSARIGDTVVHAAENPGVFAQQWLVVRSDTNCFEAPIVDYYLPYTYGLIDKVPLGESDRWLIPGTDGVFIGDISRATVSLAEAQIARGSTEAWIMGRDQKGLVANRYLELTTPSGRTFWMKMGWERPMPESAC